MDDLKLAQELYEDAIAATRDQRQQIEEDLKFSDPSNPEQWDETVKRQRELDPGGARPCLVMDHTGQYVANVAGQVTKSPPSIHTVPVGSGADVKVSEQIDGIFRHIEYASRAQTHYGIALTSAARTGVGYLIVRPEYTDRALNYQEPRISSEADPLRVVFDPWSVALDGSDADFAFKLTSLSEREFKRRWPKADPVSFGQDLKTTTATNERKSIIIAEQWWKEEKTRNVIVYTDAQGQETSSPEDDYHAACQAAGQTLPVERNYSDKYQQVKWRTLSGAAILEQPKNPDGSEAFYPADSIGIVPVYGYWGVKDGRMTFCGIPRRGRNPQRAYNYHQSELLAFMGQSPKSPWMTPVRAIKGVEAIWDRATMDSRAYLPYNDVDETGQPIAAPTRPNISVNLQNHIAGAEQALHDLEASIGMYQANLGAPSNESSGVAIDARKQQGEASTSHFPQNLASSLAQVGRVVLQMVPKLIDTKRVQRIMGIDMTPSSVTIDPEQDEAAKETDDGLSINPNIGTYDVRVVVGASYSTQRSQAQEALSEVMRNNPALTPAIAPLWAQNLDIPHADKLAQVLSAMAPPAVQAILNPDSSKQPKTEDLLQQNDQLKQGLQEAITHAHDAQAELDIANDKLREKQEQDRLAWYDAETARLKVTGANGDQIKAVVQQLLNDMLSNPQPTFPGDPQGGYPQPQPQPQPMPPPDAGIPPGPSEPQQPPNPPSAGFSSGAEPA